MHTYVSTYIELLKDVERTQKKKSIQFSQVTEKKNINKRLYDVVKTFCNSE